MKTVRKRQLKGFTLVEALIVVAIFSVLLALAAPPLSDFLQSMQARQDSNELFGSILLARSEAVARNRTVSLCMMREGHEDHCHDDGWHGGWLAFEDLDGDGDRDSDEEIIYQNSGMKANSIVESTEFTESLTYLPSGAVAATGTFNICAGSTARQIIIYATGRPRLGEASCPVSP